MMKGACAANVALIMPSFFVAVSRLIVKLLLDVRFNEVTNFPRPIAPAESVSDSRFGHQGIGSPPN